MYIESQPHPDLPVSLTCSPLFSTRSFFLQIESLACWKPLSDSPSQHQDKLFTLFLVHHIHYTQGYSKYSKYDDGREALMSDGSADLQE